MFCDAGVLHTCIFAVSGIIDSREKRTDEEVVLENLVTGECKQPTTNRCDPFHATSFLSQFYESE